MIEENCIKVLLDTSVRSYLTNQRKKDASIVVVSSSWQLTALWQVAIGRDLGHDLRAKSLPTIIFSPHSPLDRWSKENNIFYARISIKTSVALGITLSATVSRWNGATPIRVCAYCASPTKSTSYIRAIRDFRNEFLST